MTIKSYPPVSYPIRRAGKVIFDPLFKLAYPAVKNKLKVNDTIIEGLENIPKTGPVLLLSKHRHYADTPVMWAVARKANRYPNYVMKSNLPLIFSYLGGIRINRLMDLKIKLKKAKKRIDSLLGEEKRITAEAIEENRESLNYLAYLLRKGELIISFPEGTFYNDRVGPINPDKVLRRAIQVQRELKDKIAIIPVGTEYNGNSYSDVNVRIGNPFTLDDFMENDNINESGLVKRICDDIALLSGF